MQYQTVLEQIHAEIAPTLPQGRVADYIPELADVDGRKFGMAVVDTDGDCAWIGDADERFSIQSISKVFTLTMAMLADSEQLWRRVGREPSGTAFNSLVQLEYEQGIPRNPFVNAGALVVTDLILSHFGNANTAVLDFVRGLSGVDDIDYDPAVVASEAAIGYRNAALANFLKSYANLDNHPGAVLDTYCHHCSLAMSCRELACTFMYLARHGADANKVIVTTEHAKYINSLMLTSGTYDEAGNFTYHIGLPGKSGIGGGIMAVMPGMFSICVWSPGLNASGNSVAGMLALERFSQLTGHSIF
jgi:glutaminase